MPGVGLAISEKRRETSGKQNTSESNDRSPGPERRGESTSDALAETWSLSAKSIGRDRPWGVVDTSQSSHSRRRLYWSWTSVSSHANGPGRVRTARYDDDIVDATVVTESSRTAVEMHIVTALCCRHTVANQGCDGPNAVFSREIAPDPRPQL